MEPNSPKKIQFSVPVFESQLDPEASEQIRKRRPTPASLVILNDHSSPPEIDEKRISTTHEENVSPKQRKQSVYSGPNMKVCSFSYRAFPAAKYTKTERHPMSQ
ncbi:phosphatase 1 regulatory subunit 1C isoform X2 [Pelobates cultripes]|uniref:Phosphatase 1 regulatory subunit 1C isoform X2 n=1 Tax=Pelobates cultripes TaxID=61616 RepID=A0AAD1SMC6_PELCU|nr:phosphatase 1 regulatory subunit 1C isoform X2 [Pelobates cultripes]